MEPNANPDTIVGWMESLYREYTTSMSEVPEESGAALQGCRVLGVMGDRVVSGIRDLGLLERLGALPAFADAVRRTSAENADEAELSKELGGIIMVEFYKEFQKSSWLSSTRSSRSRRQSPGILRGSPLSGIKPSIARSC